MPVNIGFGDSPLQRDIKNSKAASDASVLLAKARHNRVGVKFLEEERDKAELHKQHQETFLGSISKLL